MKLSLILGAVALAAVLSLAILPGPAALAILALALGTALLQTGRRIVLGAVAVVLFGLLAPAWAETAASASSDVNPIVALLLPALLALGSILTPMIGGLVWARLSPAIDRLQQWSGVQIDATHREALHSAIDTGLKLAFARGAPAAAETLEAHLAAGRVGEVASWVYKSVPGAVAHLGVTSEILDGLTTARLSDSLASAASSALALPGAILGGLAGSVAPASPAPAPSAPSCPVCGTTDPTAPCSRTDCPDAQAAAAAG